MELEAIATKVPYPRICIKIDRKHNQHPIQLLLPKEESARISLFIALKKILCKNFVCVVKTLGKREIPKLECTEPVDVITAMTITITITIIMMMMTMTPRERSAGGEQSVNPSTSET